ncbi:unnamed protein product [Heterobilharzia americana]|nr:unnamed protein product [Heterobilharzia americana]CAH8662020.1 unnamed protein product [Heterobilharzia americana]
MSSFIHRVFNNYCCCDGLYLDKEGCKLLFIELCGRKPNKQEMELLISSFDAYFKGEPVGLTFYGLLSSIQILKQNFQIDLSHSEKQKRLYFDSLDLRSKNFVTMRDLCQVSSRYLPALKSGLFRTVFKEFDRECDDRVSYEDYLVTTGCDWEPESSIL